MIVQNIEHLDLSHNKLRALHHLQTLQQLRSLSVAHNQLKDLYGLEHLSSLCVLDASSNYITCVRGVQRLPALHILNLSDNELADSSMQPLAMCASMMELDVRNNAVSCAALVAVLQGLPELQVCTHSRSTMAQYRACDTLALTGVIASMRVTL